MFTLINQKIHLNEITILKRQHLTNSRNYNVNEKLNYKG